MPYPAEHSAHRAELLYQLLRVYAFAAVDTLFDPPPRPDASGDAPATDSENRQ